MMAEWSAQAPNWQGDVVFERIMAAGWGDMDFNSHMRNTAYLDKCADVRMMFFAEHGFPMAEFARLRIGPVVFRDEVDYYREVHLLESLRVTLALAGMAPDGSRFVLRNEFFRAAGDLSARVTTTGGWLDLSRRRLTEPPAELLQALQAMPRAADFREIPPRGTAG